MGTAVNGWCGLQLHHVTSDFRSGLFEFVFAERSDMSVEEQRITLPGVAESEERLILIRIADKEITLSFFFAHLSGIAVENGFRRFLYFWQMIKTG